MERSNMLDNNVVPLHQFVLCLVLGGTLSHSDEGCEILHTFQIVQYNTRISFRLLSHDTAIL